MIRYGNIYIDNKGLTVDNLNVWIARSQNKEIKPK